MVNPIEQVIENDIDAAIEARREAEIKVLNSAEIAEIDPEEAPYCCSECEGQENLFATQRSVR